MPPDAKTLGAYFTPEAVADALVRWAVRSPDDLLLDPSSGKELSALWEADQEQQLESAESMHAWMRDIRQLVKDFARQAEQRSSALQEQVQQLEKQVNILTRQYALITADYKEIAAVLRRV